MDIEGELSWLANAKITSEQSPKLEQGDKCIKIIAQIESMEQGECCVLRIGNSILMADIKNISKLEKGTFIELNPKAIKVFSTKL